MKNLLSERFTLGATNEAIPLSRKQLEYRDNVKRELHSEFAFVRNLCPCQKSGENNDVIISERDRYGLPLHSVLCLECGTIRIDPYLDPPSLSKFYENYYQQMYGRDVEMDSYFARQKQYGKKFYHIVKETLKPASNILEFGCGAGGALTIFKDHGHHVFGTEYSQKMIDFGKQSGLQNLFFGSLADISKKFTDLKFDVIYSNHVFEHINQPYECLQNCIDLLKPDGSIICAVPDVYNIHSSEYSFPNGDLMPMLHLAHIFNYSFECLEHMATKLGAGIERLFPDPALVTPTSVMPEIWFRIYKTEQYGQSKLSSRTQARHKNATDYLGYFRNLEETFIQRGTTDEIHVFGKLKNKVKQLLNWKK